MHRVPATWKPSPSQRHQSCLQAAKIETVAECQPHVAGAVKIVGDKGRVNQPIVLGQRGAGFEILEDRARRIEPRLDRVVNPLERRHIHESGGVAE